MSAATAAAYFFELDRLLIPDAWSPERSFRNDSLLVTRLSVSEMSYFSLLVISDMVMAKPHEVEHTLRAALITQCLLPGFRGDLFSHRFGRLRVPRGKRCSRNPFGQSLKAAPRIMDIRLK